MWLKHDFIFTMCSLYHDDVYIKKLWSNIFLLAQVWTNNVSFLLNFVLFVFFFLLFRFSISDTEHPVIWNLEFSLSRSTSSTLLLSRSLPQTAVRTVSITIWSVQTKNNKKKKNKTTIKSIDLIIYFRCCKSL